MASSSSKSFTFFSSNWWAWARIESCSCSSLSFATLASSCSLATKAAAVAMSFCYYEEGRCCAYKEFLCPEIPDLGDSSNLMWRFEGLIMWFAIGLSGKLLSSCCMLSPSSVSSCCAYSLFPPPKGMKLLKKPAILPWGTVFCASAAVADCSWAGDIIFSVVSRGVSPYT